MVSYVTLTKLARAERNAAELGLERTAGRLCSLRRQLEGFKHLSEADKEKRAYWAMAKLEDTKNCLEQEINANRKAREESEWDKRALSAATKGLVYIGSIAIYVRFINSLIERGEEAGGLLVASAVAAAAVYAVKKAIDRVFGLNRFDETVGFVKRMLDECRAGVSHYHDQHE